MNFNLCVNKTTSGGLPQHKARIEEKNLTRAVVHFPPHPVRRGTAEFNSLPKCHRNGHKHAVPPEMVRELPWANVTSRVLIIVTIGMDCQLFELY